MALTDFSIDTSGTPQDVQRRQKLAEALMQQGGDSSPAAGGKGGGWITALNRGLAGALGGYQQGQARQEEQQGRDSVKQLMANQLIGADGKLNPQATLALASNQWATPGQVQAVTHMGDMQAQQARQAVEDQHWGASHELQKRAAARADEGPVEKANQRIQLLKSQGVDPNSPEGRAYVISGEWTGPGGGGASLNPVYGVDAAGKPAMVQTTKSGNAITTKLPEGFQISKDPIKVDAGTHFVLLDPQTRQQIGTIPKDLAGAEREKVLGEETGKGQVALPQLLATSSQTLKAIEDVRNHPGRGFMTTGALGGMPGIPGTSGRGFTVALDQLKGKTFLEAFNALRGGGAITEAEGSKATNAMARLDRAQNKEDFEAGLNDLRDVVKAGMLRASAKARGAGGTSGGTSKGTEQAAAPETAPQADPLGIR